MENRRFVFDGFKLSEEYETGTHLVNIGQMDGMIIEMIISKKVLSFGNFLIASVKTKEGKLLWSFKEEEFDGFGNLVHNNSVKENFIILVDRQDQICKVIALSDLSKMIRTEFAGKIKLTGGRGLREIVRAKMDLAEQLKLSYVFSATELVCKKIFEKERREAIEAERKAKVKAEAARRAKREAKIRGILEQPKMEGFTEDGERRFGVPVSGDEWKILPDQTFVILMDGEKPVESFVVKKVHGGAKKAACVLVSAKKSESKKEKQALKILEMGLFDIKGDFREVPVVAADVFKKISDAKSLNGGTMLAVEDGKGKFNIYAMKGEKGVDTLGLFVSLS